MFVCVTDIEHILWLLDKSPHHRKYGPEQILRTICPAIGYKQNYGVAENNLLVAWASWAFMSDEDADNFISARSKLSASSWRSGDRVVMIDFIAPFGHTRKLYRGLRDLPHNYTRFSWIRQMKNNRKVDFSYGG